MPTGPPCDTPKSANRSSPNESTTASRSRTHASKEKSGTFQSDRPHPRSSYRTYRWNLESSSIQCRHTGLSKSNWTWLSQFAAFTRGGPSPVVAQAIRTPSSEEQKRICCSIQASRGDKGMILGAKKVRGADSLK